MVSLRKCKKSPYKEISFEDIYNYLQVHCFKCGREISDDEETFYYNGQSVLCGQCVPQEDMRRIVERGERLEKKYK